MASGGSRCVTGAFVGTGAALDVPVGFRPRAVEIINTDGACRADWTAEMPDAAMAKVVDSGAGATDLSYVTSNGVTPADDGFSLGADTDINVSGETCYYKAWD